MFKRFSADMKKYWKYAVYSAQSQLKSEVANSYLNWLWWILDPFCFMMIYYFIFGYVFRGREKYFSIFIFIGITLWDFFSKTMIQSVRLIKNNKSIVSKVYMPKYVLLLARMGVNGFKMCISIILVVIMLAVLRVPLTINLIYSVPILMTLIVLVFGCGCFLLHYGVFIEDLANAIGIFLKLLMYMTGIFWNIEDRLPKPYNTYIGKCNPLAYLLTSMRQCVLYGKTPGRKLLLFWFIVGIVISIFGVRKIYKNENSYVKVV